MWLETLGTDEREIVRITRLGRAIGKYQKPVWLHWQPVPHNAFDRVSKLANLAKAQMSACLFEEAVFLCNPRYPIFDTIGPDRSQEFQGNHGVWKLPAINQGWKNSILQYSRFARENRNLYLGTKPQVPVPWRIRA